MTKSVKLILEQDQYELLYQRKLSTGITLDFQLREAIKMYVELLNKKQNEKDNSN